MSYRANSAAASTTGFGSVSSTWRPAKPFSVVPDEQAQQARLAASLSKLRGAVSAVAAEQAYALIAQQILADTDATGVAIALDVDGEITCRASVGDAPPIGVAVKRDSGLSGHCLRQRETIYCEDTQTDARVDAAACAAMNLRSLIIAPVFARSSDNHIIGVVEVFSDSPWHFSSPLRRYVQETCVAVAELATPALEPPTLIEASATEHAVPPLFVSAVAAAPPWHMWLDSARDLRLSDLSSRTLMISGGAAVVLGMILYGGLHRVPPTVPSAPVARAAAVPVSAPAANTPVLPTASAGSPTAATPALSAKRHSNFAASAPENGPEPLKVASGHKQLVLPESDEPTTTLAPMLAKNNTAIPAGLLDANLPTVPRRAPQFAGGRLLQKVTPKYPAAISATARSSSVHLTAVVGRDGHVTSVQGESGSPILVGAAQEAVRQWIYEPFTVDGKPIEAKVQIVINFHVTDVR